MKLKIALLHLSDIHIGSATDRVIGCADRISESFFQAAREADGSAIVVTGDIVSKGSAAEFDVASKFLASISDRIKSQTQNHVGIICVPGNHDCSLIPADDTRTITIDHLIKNPADASKESHIKICTAAQKSYFDFASKIVTLPAKETHPLWNEYEWNINGVAIRISAINAAWMSQLKEAPGKLAFPIDLFDSWIKAPAHLRIALVHHPLNWYCQATYHPLRKQLMMHADMVLSGHEHVSDAIAVEDSDNNRCIQFEAGSLQPPIGSKDPSMYSIITIDTDTRAAESQTWELQGDTATACTSKLHNIAAIGSLPLHSMSLTNEFLDILSDAGGRFSHPDKDEIFIEDIYVDPQLNDLTDDTEDADPILGSAILESLKSEGQRIVIYGEDKSGKTALLLHMFSKMHAAGLVPVYVRAGDINAQTHADIQRQVNAQIDRQYSAGAASVWKSERDKLIVLIDDIDRAKGTRDTIGRIMDVVGRQSSSIAATAITGFRFEDLLADKTKTILSDFYPYEIQRFGLELRHRLVKRWCMCTQVSDIFELDQKVHRSSEIVNSVIGKNLVPATPIYILILLQSIEGGASSDIQNSGVATYYQYLIVKGLSDVGVKPDEFNELFNYLGNLAWFYSSTERSEYSKSDLSSFNKAFSQRFIEVDFASRLELLVRSRLLSKRGECYYFTYHYSYYFFLAKYVAEHLSDAGVQAALESWYQSLHRRESANAVLFLSHHRHDAGVVEKLLGVLKTGFPEIPTLSLDSDIGVINTLVDRNALLVLPASKASDNQLQQLRSRDQAERNGHDEEEAPVVDEKQEGIMKASEVSLTYRTANLLGQIVKNNYGSMERATKQNIIEEILSAPLRMLYALVKHFSDSPSTLIDEIQKNIDQNHPALKAERLEAMSKRIAFHFISAVCTGVTIRAAQMISHEKLFEDIEAVVEKKGDSSFLIAEAAAQFVRPGRLDTEKISELAKKLKVNKFAFTMLQALAGFRIQMYETTEWEIQKLCASLDISMEKSRQLDFRGKDIKITGRLAAPKRETPAD